MDKTMAVVGKVAFVVGVAIAFFGGIFGGQSLPTNDAVIWILLLAGILIGLLNVTAKERTIILSAAVALVVLGIWGLSGGLGPVADASEWLAENVLGIIYCFGLLMVPAAIIVAIKAVVSAAKPGD